MRKKKTLSEAEKKQEKMKYEIAEELGLLDKVMEYGWENLTSKESGKIGGILSSRKRREGVPKS